MTDIVSLIRHSKKLGIYRPIESFVAVVRWAHVSRGTADVGDPPTPELLSFMAESLEETHEDLRGYFSAPAFESRLELCWDPKDHRVVEVDEGAEMEDIYDG